MTKCSTQLRNLDVIEHLFQLRLSILVNTIYFSLLVCKERSGDGSLGLDWIRVDGVGTDTTRCLVKYYDYD